MKREKEYAIEIRNTIRVTDQDIEDIIVTALNGGIGYWACLDNSRPEFDAQGENDCVDVWTAKILLEGGTVVFLDEEDRDQKYYLTLGKLLDGIQEYAEKGFDKYGVFAPGVVDLCDLDAIGADIIIQLALFHEIVFA